MTSTKRFTKVLRMVINEILRVGLLSQHVVEGRSKLNTTNSSHPVTISPEFFPQPKTQLQLEQHVLPHPSGPSLPCPHSRVYIPTGPMHTHILTRITGIFDHPFAVLRRVQTHPCWSRRQGSRGSYDKRRQRIRRVSIALCHVYQGNLRVPL